MGKSAVRGLFIGLIFGIVLSTIGSILFAFVTNASAGGYINNPIEGWEWFFYISIIPIAITFAAYGKWLSGNRSTPKKLWLSGAIIAFMIVWLAGSLGTILISSLQRGFETVNISGYLIAGPIYAVILLPITCPIATSMFKTLEIIIDWFDFRRHIS